MNDEKNGLLDQQGIDAQRRRLTKAGLAAPAILGVLASKPVLAGFHQCTPSGHISGFASANNQQDCSTLGNGPSHYAAGPSTWPDGTSPGSNFINNSGGVRLFQNTPFSLTVRFAQAYQRRRLSDGAITNASVWDVLKGCAVNATTGACNPNLVLEARPGYNPDLTLGAEAVAVCMAALTNYPSGFPISPEQAIRMFNNVVVSGGLDQVTSTATWNAAEVKEYFRSLHV